jgi:hypothetical protein
MIKIRYSQFQVSILKQMYVGDCDNPKQSKKKKKIIHRVCFSTNSTSMPEMRKNKIIFF